jgi:NADPH:quinone reductase-like Zn-dependent oxidoreductase
MDTACMKAIIHTKYGPPEVAQLMEVAKPVPGDREVLIRVHATTVNRTDCGFRSAEYFVSRFFSGLLRPKYNTLGNEFAGVIENVGKAVTTFEAGNKVFGYNDKRFGAHAEYMIIAEDDAMTTMPDQFTFEEAAPLCEGAHYALCDIRVAGVKPGQEVLVYGATGAIGSAAVQLLRHFGAKVTAVCATPHIQLVSSLGADRVIDYTREDFTQTDVRYDFIFDAVGKTSFGACRPILKAKGIYISTELGKNGENIFLALATPLFGGKRVLFPLPTITKADVLFLKKLAESGQLRPLIDRRYPLEQIVEAYRYVETGQKVGNVVINLR